MQFYLAPEAQKAGYSLEWHETVQSTSALALSYANERPAACNLAYDKCWFIADQQTGGRARRGRNWYSPRGNLHTTLLLTSGVALENAAALGFVASVSLIEAIHEIKASYPEVSAKALIKWPNDILLDNAKASGVLLELGKQTSNSNVALAIGIGVNIAANPGHVGYPTSSLHDAGVLCSPVILFERLAYYWAVNFAAWPSPDAKKNIRQKWLQNAAHLSRPITVKMDGQLISGIFETIDEDFSCIIRQDNGQRTKITSGDVFFDQVASENAGR